MQLGHSSAPKLGAQTVETIVRCVYLTVMISLVGYLALVHENHENSIEVSKPIVLQVAGVWPSIENNRSMF